MTPPVSPTSLRAIVWAGQSWRVIDGDTVDLILDGPLGQFVVRVRLAGVQAPELHATDPAIRVRAEAAKAFVEAALPIGRNVLVTEARPDKFGRRNARVWRVDSTGALADLSTDLLAAGLARPYDGHGIAGPA